VKGQRQGEGLLGVFRSHEGVVEAVERLRSENVEFTVYSPLRGEWLERVVGGRKSPVRLVVLGGAVAGILSGLALALHTFDGWKLITGGKPVYPYVPLLIIGFEFMVFVGVVSLFVGMLAIGGVPRLRLPKGYDPRFSKDRFGLLVSGAGEDLRLLLEAAGAEEVRDVDA
jgi:molybdopterin-containing oxidoreductase family membrane subunit